MSRESMKDLIPREVALRLCGEIREENAHKMLSEGKMQCHFCYKFGKDNHNRLCIFADVQNRGCGQVNEHHDRLHGR